MSNLVFKVIVIGNSSVGKTAFVKSYIFGKANLENSTTVGVEFMVKTIELPNKATIKLQVWDIGGQDRSVFLMRSFCHRAHGCVLLFDVTNPVTFECISQWKRELEDKCFEDGRKSIPCLLLANKCDLDERNVKLKDIDKITEEMGFIGWKEVSVKEGLNIQESMAMLVEAMAKGTVNNSPMENHPHQLKRNGNLSQNSVPKVSMKWQNNCC